jgi:hypothetical protein
MTDEIELKYYVYFIVFVAVFAVLWAFIISPLIICPVLEIVVPMRNETCNIGFMALMH